MDMLQLFVFPQIYGLEQGEKGGEILFQQDNTPTHFSH
jgi:hypothetical protein